MPTKKDLKNYYEKYGDIPEEFNERILFIINNFSFVHFVPPEVKII